MLFFDGGSTEGESLRNNTIRYAVLMTGVLLLSCQPSWDMWKAERDMKKGRWGEAESRLEKIAENHPDSKWEQRALMLKGCAEFRRGKFEKAEETLSHAMDVFPEGDWADDCEYYLARVRFELGRVDEALAGFKRVMNAYGDAPKKSNKKIMALEEIEYIQNQRLLNGDSR